MAGTYERESLGFRSTAWSQGDESKQDKYSCVMYVPTRSGKAEVLGEVIAIIALYPRK